MIVYEFKIKAKQHQYKAIDDAIRTGQFIQNKCLRYWMDNKGVDKYALNKQCAILAKEYDFANKLNSMARQSSAERSWSAISRFYDNCQKKAKGKKGYPKFKKRSRSVEYKTTGWKLDETCNRKALTITDKTAIGRLKLKGTHDLCFYDLKQIKRVRLVKKADGYYCQFGISIDVKLDAPVTNWVVGLDVGLKEFYTDSNGLTEPNPRFYRKGEKKLKRLQKKVSRKFKKGPALSRSKGQPQSNNYQKARQELAKAHLRISRQRKEHAKRIARCVILSHDVVAYEDLKVRNLLKNHKLAKSINDAGWYQFRVWLEYFGQKFGKITVAVPPQYTSQDCSNCGHKVSKSLSTRTHQCPHCGFTADRDVNAAINILKRGLSTVGHTGTHAWGEETSTLVEEIQLKQVTSLNL
jgi:putative transposase